LAAGDGVVEGKVNDMPRPRWILSPGTPHRHKDWLEWTSDAMLSVAVFSQVAHESTVEALVIRFAEYSDQRLQFLQLAVRDHIETDLLRGGYPWQSWRSFRRIWTQRRQYTASFRRHRGCSGMPGL